MVQEFIIHYIIILTKDIEVGQVANNTTEVMEHTWVKFTPHTEIIRKQPKNASHKT